MIDPLGSGDQRHCVIGSATIATVYHLSFIAARGVFVRMQFIVTNVVAADADVSGNSTTPILMVCKFYGVNRLLGKSKVPVIMQIRSNQSSCIYDFRKPFLILQYFCDLSTVFFTFSDWYCNHSRGNI